jgi:uncharacterized phage protein (TIGR02218 family)
MRETPTSIIAQLAAVKGNLARCVRMQLRDGSALGMVDLDSSILVNGQSFRADLGLLSGDIELACGLDADTVDLRIPLRGDITRAAVLGRRYNHATVWIFDCDYMAAAPEEMPMMKGWIAEARIEGSTAIFEVRSYSDNWNLTIGSILTPRCRVDFASIPCGKTKIDDAAVVTAIDNSMEFYVDLAGTLADGYYRFGDLRFTTGVLANAWDLEVFNYTSSSGKVELLTPAPGMMAIGDTLNLRRGCSKLKRSDDPLIPTCVSYANANRFRAFDRVPGGDVYLRVPIPGQGSGGGGKK